jgi:hypothetical protein
MRGNPNPTCEKECLFCYGAEFVTTMGFERVYDKHGVCVTADPNTASGSVDCQTCGKHWTYISKSGKTTFVEWANYAKTESK